jgi:hypothetical protein
MSTKLLSIAALLSATLYAQDISGDWQGTLNTGVAQLRVIVSIAKEGAGWKATMFSIDQGSDGIPVSTVTLDGSHLKMAIEVIHGSYDGKISADGNSVDGTWTQGAPLPLTLYPPRRIQRGFATRARTRSSSSPSTPM